MLYDNARFPSSIYIAGYAVEIALKYKICKTLQFGGFPESTKEMAAQVLQFNQGNLHPLSSSISDIRNHNLPKLLGFSGIEYRIINNLLKEWAVVNTWNPENRYKKTRVLKKQVETYIKSAKKIIKESM